MNTSADQAVLDVSAGKEPKHVFNRNPSREEAAFREER
jgi:hypothetical protein